MLICMVAAEFFFSLIFMGILVMRFCKCFFVLLSSVLVFMHALALMGLSLYCLFMDLKNEVDVNGCHFLSLHSLGLWIELRISG